MEAIVGVFEAASDGGGFIINAAVELAAHDDEIAGIVAEAYRATEHFFCTLVERGRSAGEIAAHVDPQQTGGALLGLYLGLWVLMHPGAAGAPILGAVMQQVESLLPAPTAAGRQRSPTAV